MRNSTTPPPQGRTRTIRSSETLARARVDDVIHFARSLDERLPRAVCGGLALAADRCVDGERTLLDDHDRASRMRVPARGAGRVDRDLRHGYVRSDLKRDGPM